jgi:hypothetical protein
MTADEAFLTYPANAPTGFATLAIGHLNPEQPETSPRDWVRVSSEVPRGLMLPYSTRVRLYKSDKGRDYFRILDFTEMAGNDASLGFGADGKSRLITPPTLAGPAHVTWDAKKGRVTVRSATGKKVEAAAISSPGLPDGTYNIWPSYPREHIQYAAEYINLAPHSMTWWLVGYQTYRGFHLHAGRRTDGCVTVEELEKWEAIYDILIHARSRDGRFSGTITISTAK